MQRRVVRVLLGQVLGQLPFVLRGRGDLLLQLRLRCDRLGLRMQKGLRPRFIREQYTGSGFVPDGRFVFRIRMRRGQLDRADDGVLWQRHHGLSMRSRAACAFCRRLTCAVCPLQRGSQDATWEHKCTDAAYGYSWCNPKSSPCPITCGMDEQARHRARL